MAVEDFENLQSMMDIEMVIEARNVARHEEGVQPGGKRHEVVLVWAEGSLELLIGSGPILTHPHQS